MHLSRLKFRGFRFNIIIILYLKSLVVLELDGRSIFLRMLRQLRLSHSTQKPKTAPRPKGSKTQENTTYLKISKHLKNSKKIPNFQQNHPLLFYHDLHLIMTYYF